MQKAKVKKTKNVRRAVSPEMRQTLARVLAYDGGNGKASLHRLDEKGKLHRRVIPHAKTRVTGNRIKLTWGQTVNVDYADFMNDRFGYGESIWDLAGDYQIDVFQNTEERYGTEDHVSYALMLMGEMELPDGEYDIVVSVPPGIFNRVEERVVRVFGQGQPIEMPVTRRGQTATETGYDGWWTISLSKDIDKNGQAHPRRYKFNRVIVVLEGWVGYAAYRFDLDGNVIELPGPDGQDMLAGVCEIGDAGFGTFDSPILRDGSLVSDSLNAATDPNGGVGARLCRPILEKILQSVPDANLTLAHVDRMLRQYATGKDGQVKPWSVDAATVDVHGKRLKLKAVFDQYIKSYATWMWQSKITPAIRRNTDTYLADGGGWLYTVDSIRPWAKDKVVLITPEDVEHLKSFNYFELNGIGMLAFAAANIRQYMMAEE
jgi:hypothetical protein